MNIKIFPILFICSVFSLTIGASEKEKAVENAEEETAIRIKQISFEKQRLLSDHLLNGEKS